MAIEQVHLAANAGFWPAAAGEVVRFAAQTGAPDRQLHSITWIVATGAQAEAARAGLRAVVGPRAFMPPRILPLGAWLGPSAAAGLGPRLEIYRALRGNGWISEALGRQPATLWALARDIALLCDELTLAAVDSPDAFDTRLQSVLARHFQRRAARAVQAPAQLVLQLWRARRSAADGAVRMIADLAARAARFDAPLAYLADALATPGMAAVDRWESAFLQRAARRVPVLNLVPDIALALADAPLLAAAWPELAGVATPEPIAARADAVPADGVAVQLELVPGDSLEDTAGAVARQTLAWLKDGCASIALVALDRLTARRVRALLERAEVLVRDETGWKLSTTSAAAAVMRWYDLVQDQVYWRDLLDWLKSSFTLAGRPAKVQEVALIERAIRRQGAVQGLRAIRRAVADADAQDEVRSGALEVLALIESRLAATARATGSLVAHVQALQQTMATLLMAQPLADDPVGRAVLAEIEQLERDVAAHRGAASVAEFRALLAMRFEDATFIDRTVESPVTMVSLAAATLRRFDAAAVIGADAAHLPAVPDDVLFMSNAVKAELGLVTAEQSLRDQAAQLAALLVTTPRVMVSWATRRGDEPVALSPLLERLQWVSARARGDDMVRDPADERHAVAATAGAAPRPVAPGLLPARISASQAQSMVDCPYQFYARRMLGLVEPDDVVEMPDKRDFGVALHAVLKRFHAHWGETDFNAVGAEQLASSLREHARAVFAPAVERTPGLFAYEHRFAGLVASYVAWLQRHARAGWRWRSGEETHRRRVALDDGRAVELGGRVDRLDSDAAGRVHLIDYKARDAGQLRRGLTPHGEDIQLPFYGLLLPQPPHAAQYLSFDRARDGEGGVQSVPAPGPFEALVGEVGDRLVRDLQRIADGAPLPAIGAPATCRFCEMRGLCRRDHWVADDAGSGVPT